MSTQSKLFNITAATLRPGPRLVIRQQADGTVACSLTFTLRKFELGSTAIQSLLYQGARLIDLYPDVGTEWDFLYLEDYEAQDQPGGITEVSCNFKGSPAAAPGDYGFESSIIYTRNNALAERSIFSHPTFISECDKGTRETIRLGTQGIVRNSTPEDASYAILYVSNDAARDTLSDTNHKWWWDYIVTDGHLTYNKPTSEWTKSASGRGTLTAAVLAKFGKVDSSPPGNPVAPGDDVWLLSGATENITVAGSAANSYSLTWTSGDWEDTKVYAP